MEWTREQRYRKYSDWDAATLLQLQSQAATSKYQMHYHMHPLSGLMNDPNGFSYYNGEYHLFCQSYPFGPVHGLKSWTHYASDDLVHWHYLGQAINPDMDKDNAGAYSGSAMEHNGKLLLMYTGNHRDENWVRTPYQIIAEMDQDNHITKKDEAAILPPDHVTEHFRDPQLFEHDGKYYVILGAQDKATKTGQIDIYESEDLVHWHEDGYLNLPAEMGYMIECPNLVFVDGEPVLIFCPQGLDKSITNYDNVFPNMYLIGDDIDLSHAKFSPTQLAPINLDDGFDVYATQAFNAPDGTAYAISWVGLPDSTYPVTDKEGWANCYSQVKELEIKDGELYQHPVSAMENLRYDETNISNQKLITSNSSRQYELKLKIAAGQNANLYLNANDDLKDGLILNFSTDKDAHLTIDRSQGPATNPDYGTSRTITLTDNQDLDLDIFVDGSLCEVFVNDGRHVMTLRFFVGDEDRTISFDKNINYTGKLWGMHSIL